MFTHGKTIIHRKTNINQQNIQNNLGPKDELIEIKEKELISFEGPIDVKRPPDIEPPIPVKPKLETQAVPKKKNNNKKKAETQVSENEKVSE